MRWYILLAAFLIILTSSASSLDITPDANIEKMEARLKNATVMEIDKVAEQFPREQIIEWGREVAKTWLVNATDMDEKLTEEDFYYLGLDIAAPTFLEIRAKEIRKELDVYKKGKIKR